MNRWKSSLAALACVSSLAAFIACGSNTPSSASPTTMTEAGTTGDDASQVSNDAGSPIDASLPNRPKLAYTVATYNTGDLAGSYCPTRMALLKSEGFAVATITPTYAYLGTNSDAGTADGGGLPAIIDPTNVPPVSDVTACIAATYAAGLGLAFKPHIDAPQGGDRGAFDFDPMADGSYFTLVLKPYIDAFAAFQTANGCKDCTFTLYLGTELRSSVGDYPGSWLAILNEVRAYIATKNFPIAPHVTNDLLFDLPYAVTANPTLGQFISGLDSFSLSQYTPLNTHGTTVADATQSLVDYDKTLRAYFKSCGMSNSQTFPINYGEFGIGTGGLAEPWDYSSVTRPDSQITTGIEGILGFLRTKTNSPTMAWANLWTVGLTYDIMGNDVGPDGGATQYGGSPVVAAKAAVEAYNAGQ